MGYFWQETGRGSRVKGAESKFDISYFTDTIFPGSYPVKKNWFQHFPVLQLKITKDISENLNFAAFLRTTPTLKKNELD